MRVIGTTVEAAGLILQLGSICWIDLEPEGMVSAEVVGFKDGLITLVPFGDLSGVRPGSAVRLREQQFRVPIGPAVLGRVLDGFGRPLDGQGPLRAEYRVVTGAAPHPLGRARISTPISTGVRALDGLLSAGKGQRLGIFAGSGVGKSTLLAMIARHASSDVNVIALIGERGREVQEFIDEQLGPEGLARSCVVVATSDQPALLRLKAAEIATAIAESFRDEGKDVLFMMDSVTRLAMAQREIGLGAGEPPALRGYPPSVFSFLPRLARARRQHRVRHDHRLLHRPGRGRRHDRAGRRHGPVDPRRPHRPVARRWPSATTTRPSTSWPRSRGPCPPSSTRTTCGSPARSGPPWPSTRAPAT